jgi:hypothetical protein
MKYNININKNVIKNMAINGHNESFVMKSFKQMKTL